MLGDTFFAHLGVSGIGATIERAMAKVEKVEATQLDADVAAIEKDAHVG